MTLAANWAVALGSSALMLGCGASPGTQPTEANDAEAAPHQDHGEHEHGSTGEPVDPAEHAAFMKAKPVFALYCADCHTTASGELEALEHFNMDSYPFGGHHSAEAGDIVRASLGASGKRATMPKGRVGAVKGEALEAILSWANAFDRAHSSDSGSSDHDSHSH